MTTRDAERYARLIGRNAIAARLLAQAAGKQVPAHDASDWLIIMHFYILCVYVKCLGKCRGTDFQDHYQIRKWLNSETDMLAMARPYRKVEEWSRDARYEGRTFDSTEFRRFESYYCAVRDHLFQLLVAEGLTSVPRVEVVRP